MGQIPLLISWLIKNHLEEHMGALIPCPTSLQRLLKRGGSCLSVGVRTSEAVYKPYQDKAEQVGSF